MGLEYLDKVYKSMFAGGLGYLVIVSKSIGAFILVLTLWKSFFKSFSKTGKVFSEGDEGFSPYTLFRMLGLLLLVGVSTQILDIFDSACAMVESEALKGFNQKPEFFDVSAVPVTPPPANESAIDGVLRKIGEVANMMNPSSWTGGAYTHITQFMLKILDFLIYPVFLAERYFFMGLIKIFVPLMIAFSIFEKTKDYIYNVFKMYARYYLVIIPYAFVIIFANTLFDTMTVLMPVSGIGPGSMAISSGLLVVLALILVIVIKIKLFKVSMPFMKELIK
ncbi:MAG TPA: type IV secretion system protein [Anaerovoracaceae bacterium]|nr:type IV secretion system protein [Anaerovoracaceae bacterium]